MNEEPLLVKNLPRGSPLYQILEQVLVVSNLVLELDQIRISMAPHNPYFPLFKVHFKFFYRGSQIHPFCCCNPRRTIDMKDELSFNNFHFLFFTSSGRLQDSPSNSISVSFPLNFKKIFELLKFSSKSSKFSKIFKFFSFICWGWWCQLVWPWSLCVIIYLLSVSLWAISKERS